jgi:hypothetical protein
MWKYSSTVVVDLYIRDCDVFVYSVFVLYFKMTCFISSCPVTNLGSKKCVCTYVKHSEDCFNNVCSFFHKYSVP